MYSHPRTHTKVHEGASVRRVYGPHSTASTMRSGCSDHLPRDAELGCQLPRKKSRFWRIASRTSVSTEMSFCPSA
jgi:hypothetical protein